MSLIIIGKGALLEVGSFVEMTCDFILLWTCQEEEKVELDRH